jgi:hypothetical protein
MVPEVYQVFWAGMAAGEFINDAAIAAGSYRKQGARWLAAADASSKASRIQDSVISHDEILPCRTLQVRQFVSKRPESWSARVHFGLTP